MKDPTFSELLENIGWSNKELAERLNVTQMTISRWHRDGAPKYIITYLKQVDRLVGKQI